MCKKVIWVSVSMLFLLQFVVSSDEKREANMIKLLNNMALSLERARKKNDKLTSENDKLKNDLGEQKAQVKALILQLKAAKGEIITPLTDKEKMAEDLKLIIPKFRFSGKLEDAMKKITALSIRLDPYGQGVKINTIGLKATAEKTFHFDLESMPLGECIRYISIASAVKYKVEKGHILISEKDK